METNQPAHSEADTPDPRANENGERPRQHANGDKAYPNNANDRNGAGSPYAGTQSPDANAPDGNQIPKGEAPDKNQPVGNLGSEYADDSSYGNNPPPESYGGSEPEGTDTDASGSPIR
jgi:hypothetical protein